LTSDASLAGQRLPGSLTGVLFEATIVLLAATLYSLNPSSVTSRTCR